jgi:hypothetical protein
MSAAKHPTAIAAPSASVVVLIADDYIIALLI